jgi:hypothetical protein
LLFTTLHYFDLNADADIFYLYSAHFDTIFRFVRDSYSGFLTVSIQNQSHLADVSTQGESPAAAAVINEATTALRDGHRYHSVHNNQLEALWRSTDADTDVQL